MNVKRGIILAAAGVIIFFFSIQGWGADWKQYALNDRIVFYYDAESITRPSREIVRVWEKRIYTEKGIIDAVKELGKKYKDMSFKRVLYEFHCADKKVNILSQVWYSKDGEVLNQDSYGTPHWQFVIPDSVGDNLYRRLCIPMNTTAKAEGAWVLWEKWEHTENFLGLPSSDNKPDWEIMGATPDYQQCLEMRKKAFQKRKEIYKEIYNAWKSSADQRGDIIARMLESEDTRLFVSLEDKKNNPMMTDSSEFYCLPDTIDPRK